jgi:hypothetical protein
MSIIEQLSKKDRKWRKIAYYICQKDEMLADDLTNDMYIKLKDITIYNESLVTTTIRNLFNDYIKRQNKSTEIVNESVYNNEVYELSDYELRVLDRFYKLPELTQELIKNKASQSFTQLEENYGIYPMKAHREIRKAIKTITDEK